MLEQRLTNEEIINLVNSFIWTFKIGDNIAYNLRVLNELLSIENTFYLRKPISIIAVSITEAILVDQASRLKEATNHYPAYPNAVTNRENIKNRLNKESVAWKSVFEGDEFKYRRMKNYGLSELVNLYSEFKLLGENDYLYEKLLLQTRYRNRVHINNYFGNFERNESRVFTETRAQSCIDTMIEVAEFMAMNYARP